MEQITLMDVRGSIQKIIDSMSTILGVEIVVADLNCSIVAVSENYVREKGDFWNATYVKMAIEAEEVVIVKNPADHIMCRDCEMKEDCPLTILIDCPIFCDGEIIGLITLMGLDTQQKQLIIEREDEFVRYFKNMAELISGQYLAKKHAKSLSAINQELTTMINKVSDGIITVDNKLQVRAYNKTALDMLELSSDDLQNRTADELITNMLAVKAITDKQDYDSKELLYKLQHKNMHVVSSASLIKQGDEVIGAVEVLKEASDIREMVGKIADSAINFNTFEDILGESHQISQTKQRAREVSKGDSSVLITGESGTGKEMFARAIHYNSHRYHYPFKVINCAAIPENLVESELFGYVAGAFTGAHKQGKVGKFEQANGGTVFLDEIGDMDLSIQSKILRVIQERYIERVGGKEQIPIDVRIIAATNKDLDHMVENGEFREDLYYRVNVIPLHIPPLRYRKDDIPVIANYFLNKYATALNKSIIGFMQEALQLLSRYSWPGNIRELENAIEFAVNVEVTNQIRENSLPKKIINQQTRKTQLERGTSLKEHLRRYEQEIINYLLDKYGDDLEGKNKVAEELGISLASLYRKISASQK